MSTVAIIGGGPRSLSALESLTAQLCTEGLISKVHIFMFSDSTHLGAGDIYSCDQPDTNWLNLSQRGLTLPCRDPIESLELIIPGFPSFHEWSNYCVDEVDSAQVDLFPHRSTLGRYLSQRFLSISKPLERLSALQVVQQQVECVRWTGKVFDILTASGEFHSASEVALAIGHQPCETADELARWATHTRATTTAAAILNPYPVSAIIESSYLSSSSVVAVRGFGLAMIDVVRALTIGRGGRFDIINDVTREMIYTPSGHEPQRIVPYSLDGLPMAPKLLNMELDELFVPTEHEKQSLRSELIRIAKSGEARDSGFLINRLSTIAARIFLDLQDSACTVHLSVIETVEIIRQWLLDDEYTNDSIVSKQKSCHYILKSFVDMATGQSKVSLDFCVGHVWRHCQPTMYEALSFAAFDDGLMSSIIDLDERMKRYAYGPPVASLQQLRALLAADILTLNFIDNPDIDEVSTGWRLTNDGHKVTANMMVNSVLDPPAIKKVDSPIVKNLLSQGIVRPIGDGLGVETGIDGQVTDQTTATAPPLAVLGRLAKGTLLGVDAILECFNHRSENWAAGVIRRIKH